MGPTGPVAASAATGGHIPILKWLISLGYAMDEQILVEAANNNQLHFVLWAIHHGCVCSQTVGDEITKDCAFDHISRYISSLGSFLEPERARRSVLRTI